MTDLTKSCCCPSEDARWCIRLRYPSSFGESDERDEECTCGCHTEDNDFDDADTP